MTMRIGIGYARVMITTTEGYHLKKEAKIKNFLNSILLGSLKK